MKIEDLCLKDLRKFAKTAGIKNVSKSKKKLLAELKDRQIGGGIPKEPVIFQATKEAYSKLAPDKLLDGFSKILESPTLDAYLRETDKTILIGVRGTKPTDPKDLSADSVLFMNGLRYTTRYRNDKAKMNDIIKAYPPVEYDYTLGGHSLSGAITRQFKREYPFIKKIVQYNPAFQPSDLANQSGDKGVIKRYYLENDFLYNLGGRFFRNNIVLPTSEKKATSFFGKLRKKLPTSKLMSGMRGHKLDNFNQLYTQFASDAAMNPDNQVNVSRSKMALKKPTISMDIEDAVKAVDVADEIEDLQDPKPITSADQVNVIIRNAKAQRDRQQGIKPAKRGFISNLVRRTRGLFGRGIEKIDNRGTEINNRVIQLLRNLSRANKGELPMTDEQRESIRTQIKALREKAFDLRKERKPLANQYRVLQQRISRLYKQRNQMQKQLDNEKDLTDAGKDRLRASIKQTERDIAALDRDRQVVGGNSSKEDSCRELVKRIRMAMK